MDIESKNLATIPHSFLIVIDDVGWWCGKDQRYKNGPSRSGLEQRRHVIEDYQAIVALGKSLNMRIKCGFVIGEWDRTNLLAGVRNSNKYGTQWDQASRLDPAIDEVRDLLNDSSDYLELAIHGLVHMYWNDSGKMQHAEFYQKAADGKGYIMTPPDIVREHLDAYFAIYQQNGFTMDLTSFIPPCFQYIYSPERDQLSAILSEYGIFYVSTPYASMGYTSHVKPVDVCVENGIITVDRTSDLTSWDVVGANPPGVIKNSYYGLHWINILNNDVEKNGETVQAWIRYFAQYKHRFDLFVARNNAVASSQALYKKHTKIVVDNDKIVLDFAAVDKQVVSALEPAVYLNVVNEKVPKPDHTVDLRVYEESEKFTTYQVTRRMPGSVTGKTVLMLSDRQATDRRSVVNI
ncbi:MAG: hypothetical protein SCM11_13045 [Bacillota bacterium]|nr:hypothetical protein [Bacillota bacterium]